MEPSALWPVSVTWDPPVLEGDGAPQNKRPCLPAWSGGHGAAVSVHFVMKREIPQLQVKYMHFQKDFFFNIFIGV